MIVGRYLLDDPFSLQTSKYEVATYQEGTLHLYVSFLLSLGVVTTSDQNCRLRPSYPRVPWLSLFYWQEKPVRLIWQQKQAGRIFSIFSLADSGACLRPLPLPLPRRCVIHCPWSWDLIVFHQDKRNTSPQFVACDNVLVVFFLWRLTPWEMR
jgi:hypothetical protein